jgi:translation initiation factor IF-2
MQKAEASEPIWIIGFSQLVPVGVTLHIFKNNEDVKLYQKVKEKKEVKPKKTAKKSQDKEKLEETEQSLAEEIDEKAILSQLISAQEMTEKPKLNLIVKAENQGTLEVVVGEIQKLSIEEVDIVIIESSVGDITDEDIIKAKDTNGIVIGFRTNISKQNALIAKHEKVLVRSYDIIYDLVDEITEVVDSFIEPAVEEVEIARASIKKVFELSNGTKVAGCKVMKGTIVKGHRCFIERKSEKNKRIGEAKIVSMKHGKDEIREAAKGTECGIFLEPQLEIEVGDEIVCFKVEKVA